MSAWPGSSSNGVYMNPSSMSSLYPNPANPQNIDLNSFALQNGSVNPQQAFGSQTYNVNPVIPSKRPRPSDDQMHQSPHAPSNSLDLSRSHTPMQGANNFGAFPPQQQQPQQQPQSFQAPPTPYQHLQQNATASANATPSPTMQPQQFRPPQQPPQRMSTASPATFGQAMSPAPSANNMLPQFSTPQQSFNQNFNPASSGAMNMGTPGNMAASVPQMQHQYQQKLYQQRLQQQQQRLQANNMAAVRASSAQQSAPFNPPASANAGAVAANGAQMPGQGNNGASNAQKQEQWLRTVQQFCQQNNIPFNPAPTVSGRPINLYYLWVMIIQFGGSQRVTSMNGWPTVTAKLGINNQQYQSAPQELRQIWESILGQYERMFMTARMQARQQQAQAQARAMAGLGNPPQGSPTRQPDQLSQQQQTMMQMQQQAQQQQAQAAQQKQQHQLQMAQAQAQAQQLQAQTQPPQQQQIPTPIMNPQATPTQRPTPNPLANGITTPQSAALNEFRRTSSFAKPDSVPPPDQDVSRVSASPAIKAQSIADGTPSLKREVSTADLKHMTDQDTEYEPHRRNLDFYGGYDIMPLFKLGGELVRLIPDVPSVDEMGLIDIRALTLSLQSGIHAEVRHALDHLILISIEPRVSLDLDKCEDLADVLIDCAETQLDVLADEAAEVSDGLDLPAYEEVVRSCRVENESLQDIPPVGSSAYQLDRAADRLIAVTTLLRNLSFNESNHRLLSTTSVIGLVSNAIRLLGTRNMLLRSSKNVADFYKDIITFLSNITGVLELPSRDDALHILQFILAFAPQPSPTFSFDAPLRFSPYVPLAQRHLPLAVDCLAKLLARQEPNRSLYRSIFTSSQNPNSSESASSADLLTCAFGLSISVLPERSKRVFSTATEFRTVEARKALLTQGMLAADILASMLPAYSPSDDSNDKNLARAWLESEDRWSGGLLHMAYVLSKDRGQAQRAQAGHHMAVLEPDVQGYGLITHRGLGMLTRLVEKAGSAKPKRATSDGSAKKDNSEDEDEEESDLEEQDAPPSPPQWMVRSNPTPQRETVLGALLSPDADKVALRLLCRLYDMAG